MKMLCKYRNKRGGTVLLLCIALQGFSVAVFSQESTVPLDCSTADIGSALPTWMLTSCVI